MKFASITVLILLAGLPVAAPLLAVGPCCPESCQPALRAADSCCYVSAVPETTEPARLAASPKLAVSAMSAPAAHMAAMLFDAPAVVVRPITPAVFCDTPLRI